jgi:hypothetical protein
MLNCDCGRLEQVENLFTDLDPTKDQIIKFHKLLRELSNSCWNCGEATYRDNEDEVW